MRVYGNSISGSRNTLVIYLDQNQTDYSNDTKSVLRNLRRSIDRQVIETRKQPNITNISINSSNFPIK